MIMEEILTTDNLTDDTAIEELTEESDDVEYSRLIEEDIAELKKSFPELKELSDITELDDPVRYGALRDLGLTAEEAYRATTKRTGIKTDNRAHLRSSAPKGASSPGSGISYKDMQIAREIFPGVSDSELQKLYKKVTR